MVELVRDSSFIGFPGIISVAAGRWTAGMDVNGVMDIEDIQSNLHALRQLYGLLKQDEDGLPNVTSETLDNKARLLLKSLLDSATERVLKAHSRIVAGQADASLKCTSGQPQRLKDSEKEQHLELSNALKQSWEKQSVSTETG
nr:uncharacterized protein LOC114077322 [Ipomoea trifida]